MKFLKAILFGLTGALAMLMLTVADDGTYELVSQLRRVPDKQPWMHPVSLIVRSRQEADRKTLHRACLNEMQKVERAIFAPSICTTARSRTCDLGRLRWTGKEILAPLVDSAFWDYPSLDDRFSTLGSEKLRYDLSERSHILNEALSNGAVNHDRNTVSFDDGTLATSYLSKIGDVCAALDLAERRHITRPGGLE